MKYLDFRFSCDSIRLEMCKFNTLVLENKFIFYDFLAFCFCGFAGNKNYINSVEINNKESLDNYIYFIDNIFELSINTKKNINALYKIIKAKYFDILKGELNDLKIKISDIVSRISLDFDVELTSSGELTEADIFKMVDLRFCESDMGILHKLLKYIFVLNELLGIKIFILHSIHSFLENDQIQILVKETAIKEISLIVIENGVNFTPLENEKISIVDKDLCVI